MPCLTPLAHDGTMGVQGLWTAVKEITNNKSLHEALPRDGGGSERSKVGEGSSASVTFVSAVATGHEAVVGRGGGGFGVDFDEDALVSSAVASVFGEEEEEQSSRLPPMPKSEEEE